MNFLKRLLAIRRKVASLAQWFRAVVRLKYHIGKESIRWVSDNIYEGEKSFQPSKKVFS